MSAPCVYKIPVLGRYAITHGILAWPRHQLSCVQDDRTMFVPFWRRPRMERLRGPVYDKATLGGRSGYGEQLGPSSIAQARARLAG